MIQQRHAAGDTTWLNSPVGEYVLPRRLFRGTLRARLTGHTFAVNCLAVLPGGTLASGSLDKTVRLWREGNCVATLTGHTKRVRCLAVMPDGTLASASDDNNVLIWS